MNWEQIIAMNAPVITVVIGLFVWLRTDIKRLEDRLGGEIRRLENKFESEIKRLEDKMEAGFLSMYDRLRGVETEQARVAGLLEGLALTGKVPERSSEPR